MIISGGSGLIILAAMNLEKPSFGFGRNYSKNSITHPGPPLPDGILLVYRFKMCPLD